MKQVNRAYTEQELDDIYEFYLRRVPLKEIAEAKNRSEGGLVLKLWEQKKKNPAKWAEVHKHYYNQYYRENKGELKRKRSKRYYEQRKQIRVMVRQVVSQF